jgi:hypothetical protein
MWWGWPHRQIGGVHGILCGGNSFILLLRHPGNLDTLLNKAPVIVIQVF